MNALEKRHTEAVKGGGNICSTLPAGALYEPFTASSYPYRSQLGRLTTTPWLEITNTPSWELVPIDPYAASVRRKGTAMWDAVVGIPAATIRPRSILEASKVSALRSINNTWLGPMIKGMNRVGVVVPGTPALRPSGPYIFDLLYSHLGWKIMEGAHILVHRRKRDIWRRHRDQHIAITAKLLQRYVAEIVVCMTYGLPLDVSDREDEVPGYPSIAQYGIDIRTSDRFRCPTLKVPWVGPGSPIPDVTMGYIATGVFIEPVPRGAITGKEGWLECNRWTCLPTIVSIAGWEMADVVSHFPLGASDPASKESQRCYVMNPADLMPPDTFPELLESAYLHRGQPVVDNVRYFRAEEWLNSADYKCGLERTPSFPCEFCMSYNQRTEGVPAKPYAIWKKAVDRTKVETQEVEEWERTRRLILRIAEKATIFCESREAGGRSKALWQRAVRKKNFLGDMRFTDKVKTLKRRIDKLYADGIPSRALEAKKELDTLIEKHKKEEEACYHLESTSVSLGDLPSFRTPEQLSQ